MEFIKIIVELILGIGIIYLAYQANKIAKSNYKLSTQNSEHLKYQICKDEREIINQVYSKVTKSIDNTFAKN